MSTVATAHHHRDNRSLLASAERTALLAMARRMPACVGSDHLTFLALLAMLGAGAGFLAARWYPWALGLVVLSLAANWFGDSLDGTLARVRRHERPRYGYYVDHVLDMAGAVALLGGLAGSNLMHPIVALALLAAYLLVLGEVYLATHVRGVFRMARWGFGPTELRIVLAIGALYVWSSPWITLLGREVRLFDVGGLVAAAGLLGTFVLSAAQNGLALYVAEPIPRTSNDAHRGAKRRVRSADGADGRHEEPGR